MPRFVVHCKSEKYDRGRKGLAVQRGDPQPFMTGGMRCPLSPAITIALQHFLGTHYRYRLRVVESKRQAPGIP